MVQNLGQQKVAELIAKLGLTELATRSGCDAGNLSRIGSGERNAGREYMQRLAVTGIPLDAWFTPAEPPLSTPPIDAAR
jgi:hypothetical protein